MPRDFVNEDLGVAAGASPFAKLLAPADDVLRCLIEARKRMETNWHQLRSDPDAISIGDDPKCMSNTLHLFAGKCASPLHKSALAYLAREIRPTWDGISLVGIFNYNDTHSHAEVLATMDGAIAARRAELAS